MPPRIARPGPTVAPTEQDDLRDIVGVETPSGIESIADAAAAEAHKSDIVAQRMSDEGCKRSLLVGQRSLHIAQREPVERGQA